jgi:hypothetical protein
LHGRKKAIGILGQIKRLSRSYTPLVGEIEEPRFARCHDGDFRHGENAICDEKQKDGNYFKDYAGLHKKLR